MTNRYIKKQLAGEEDLLIGETTENQQRAGGTYPITGLRYIRTCNSLAELQALDPDKFPKASLHDGTSVQFYEYDTLAMEYKLVETVQGTQRIYDTVTAMRIAQLQEGLVVETAGYNTLGDLGNGKYVIKTAAQATLDSDYYAADSTINILLDNGNVAVNITSYLNVRQCGLTPALDSRDAVEAMFFELKDSPRSLYWDLPIRVVTPDTDDGPIQLYNTKVIGVNGGSLTVNNDKVPAFYAYEKTLVWQDLDIFYDGTLNTAADTTPGNSFHDNVLKIAYPDVAYYGANGYQASFWFQGSKVKFLNCTWAALEGATADQLFARVLTHNPSINIKGTTEVLDSVLDGVHMGFLCGNGTESLVIKNLKSFRYGVMPSNGASPSGGDTGWSPPPHILYTPGGIDNIDIDGIYDYGIDAGGGNWGQTSIKPVNCAAGLISNVISFRNHGLADWSGKNLKLIKCYWKGDSTVANDGVNGVKPMRQTEPDPAFGPQEYNEIDVTLIDTALVPTQELFSDATGSITVPKNCLYKIKVEQEIWPVAGTYYDPLYAEGCHFIQDITIRAGAGAIQANLLNANSGNGANLIEARLRGFGEASVRVLSGNNSKAVIQNLDKGSTITLQSRMYMEEGVASELLQAADGLSFLETQAAFVPAGSVIFAVGCRVIDALGLSNGLTGFSVGTAADADKYGLRNSTTGATDNVDWTDTDLSMNTGGTTMRVTAVGGTFDGAGSFRLSAHYRSMNIQTDVE